MLFFSFSPQWIYLQKGGGALKKKKNKELKGVGGGEEIIF